MFGLVWLTCSAVWRWGLGVGNGTEKLFYFEISKVNLIQTNKVHKIRKKASKQQTTNKAKATYSVQINSKLTNKHKHKN